ncbi:hypothetical protein [Actinokineospora sp.]|uniref:hypothetical protein n=1 Tax=Actinokineospora sp. TaxID=1872133 RepID=UPI004037D253
MAAVALATPTVLAALPTAGAPVDAADLRDRMLASAGQPHQGFAEVRGTLALPELPRIEDVTALLTGTTRVRTWYGSPDRWRFDVVSTAGERDVYRTPDGEYVWDYGANLLTQVLGEAPVRLPRAGDFLPPDLARRVLSTAGDDAVSPLAGRRVAGREAVGLRLIPADPASTIGRVDLWADADTGLPVHVEVTARGADTPVLVSRFVELSTTAPDAGVLTPVFAPGAGFTVVAAPDIADALGVLGGDPPPARLAGRALREADAGGVRGVGVYGTDLSAFIALPVPREVGASASDAAGKAGATSVELPGGRAMSLSIAPLSVVIARSDVARRWYLLAGLVAPQVLLDAAAELSLVPRSGR